jgi:hypothetical protein
MDWQPGSALTWLAIIALLTLFAGQAYHTAVRDSVTIDEFVHLPVGLYILKTRDFTPERSTHR